MSKLDTNDYRNAPSGIGPQASEWQNKPHRLVYDLCHEVERLQDLTEKQAAAGKLLFEVLQIWRNGATARADIWTITEKAEKAYRDL